LKKRSPSLNAILSADYIDELLKDEEAINVLKQHLPEEQQDARGIKDNLKSPQLQQAIDTLDEALNSEEGVMVLQSLGFDAQAFQNASDGTDAFMKALEKWGKENKDK